MLDEPASGLDPVGQRDIRNLMLEPARTQGATILLSSHQLSEVEAVSDEVTILNRGRVAAEATSTSCSTSPGRPRSRARGLTAELPAGVAAIVDGRRGRRRRQRLLGRRRRRPRASVDASTTRVARSCRSPRSASRSRTTSPACSTASRRSSRGGGVSDAGRCSPSPARRRRRHPPQGRVGRASSSRRVLAIAIPVAAELRRRRRRRGLPRGRDRAHVRRRARRGARARRRTAIPAEVERRTVFNVISQGVRRWQYVVGTWLGMFVVLGVVMAAFTVVDHRHRARHATAAACGACSRRRSPSGSRSA